MQTIDASSVQFGCGNHAPGGWLNFDSSITLRFERIPLLGALYSKNSTRFPAAIRYGDIIRGLPVPNGTVKRLYASHVLEHMPYDDAVRALQNCYVLLAPSGIFRLIVPDLSARIDVYAKAAARGDASAAIKFMDSTGLGRRRRPRTLVSRLASIWGSSEHLWMWDEPSLTAALQSAGFSSIRRCEYGDSSDSEFSKIEVKNRFVNGDIVELAMECVRV